MEFDNRKIFISHFHDLADSMAKSGDFDAVFYGHDHIKNRKMIDNCLVVNPGEISAHKTGRATYAIYETRNNSVEFFEVENSVTLRTEVVRKLYEERRI